MVDDVREIGDRLGEGGASATWASPTPPWARRRRRSACLNKCSGSGKRSRTQGLSRHRPRAGTVAAAAGRNDVPARNTAGNAIGHLDPRTGRAWRTSRTRPRRASLRVSACSGTRPAGAAMVVSVSKVDSKFGRVGGASSTWPAMRWPTYPSRLYGRPWRTAFDAPSRPPGGISELPALDFGSVDG